MDALRSVVYHAVERPVRYVYMEGYWGGRPTADICASLTLGTAVFWAESVATEAECMRIIDTHVRMLLAWVFAVAYSYAIVVGVHTALMAVRLAVVGTMMLLVTPAGRAQKLLQEVRGT